MTDEKKHWLMRRPERDPWWARPENVRWVWAIFAGVLAATVVGQGFVEVHDYFQIDGTFAFSALYGFATCVLMVIFAKVLGWWLKRPDDYYPEESLFVWSEASEPLALPRPEDDDV